MQRITAIIILTVGWLFVIGVPTVNYALFHQTTYLRPPPSEPSQRLIPILHRLQPKLTQKTAIEIARAVHKNATEFGFPPELIIAIMMIESSLKPNSTSKSQCVGLMQINPKAHPDKCQKFSRGELYTISTNINIGCRILKEYYDRENDVQKALYRYRGAEKNRYVQSILTCFANEIISQKNF